ncbi:MAG TPA: sensor histidine kinase [Ktedonobacteraceae bacterium]|jgi:two-component system sensor histidine kinase DesK
MQPEQIRSEASPATREEDPQKQARASGISPLAWRIFVLMWLVFIIIEMVTLLKTHLTPLRLGIVLVAILCFVGLYTWLVWPHPLSFQAQARKRSGMIWLPFTLLIALTVFLNLVYGSSWLYFFIFSGVAAGVIFPASRVSLIIPALMLLTLSLGQFLVGPNWQQIAIPVIIVAGAGFGITGIVRSFSTIRELQIARGELARMEVMEERFRLARDLHDLLGHKLSMITLKSELAGRLIEKAPERALKEVNDIEQTARQMMREVREAVAGYRQPQLESELIAARQILEAAGISCSITQEVGTLPPPVDAVLAWTIREGVTNVIRHGHAHRCFIRLSYIQGNVHVEIVNDGYQERKSEQQKSGTGLAGVSERVAIMGGRFEAGPVRAMDAHCFRLWVELPPSSMVENVKE